MTRTPPQGTFLLPPGNVQISFSGGRTSGYMLHQIMDANGSLPDRVQVVFTNTGREFPETLDFVAEVSQRWQVPIAWVEYRAAAPFFEVVGRQGASQNGEPFDALANLNATTASRHAQLCAYHEKEARHD